MPSRYFAGAPGSIRGNLPRVEIRVGRTTDIGAVLDFWRVATVEPSVTGDAAGLAALFDRSPDALLLAVDGGVILGTVIVGWDGWRGSMYRIAVLPTRRREGIGRALVAEGERRLRACGARKLHLNGAEEGERAQGVWAGAAYEAKQ